MKALLLCLGLLTFGVQAQTIPAEVVKDQQRQDVVVDREQNKQDAAIDDTEQRVTNIEAQALTDRQFMAMLIAIVLTMLAAVWWMQYRATSRLEGASRSTWEGIGKILVRTELLQAYLEREAPELLAEFDATLQSADAK